MEFKFLLLENLFILSIAMRNSFGRTVYFGLAVMNSWKRFKQY